MLFGHPRGKTASFILPSGFWLHCYGCGQEWLS